MAFLFSIPAAGGFYCESDNRSGFTHRELVTGNPIGISQLITHKIHLWGAFIFFGRGYPIYVSCFAIQTEMALCRASFLYSFLHLQFGFRCIAVCFAYL